MQLVGGDRVFLTGNKGGVSRTNPPVLTALDEEYIRGFDLVHTSVYSYSGAATAGAAPRLQIPLHGFLQPHGRRLSAGMLPAHRLRRNLLRDQPEREIRDTMGRIMAYGCRQIVTLRAARRARSCRCCDRFYEQSPIW